MVSTVVGRTEGKIAFEYPEPFIFLGKISGHYAESLLDRYIGGMEAALDKGQRIHAFHDWDEMTSYDTKCRKDMTDWTFEHIPKLARHHVLLRSKLVAMGVATANLLLGGNLIVTHTARSTFDRAIQDARRLARVVRSA